MTYQDQHTPWRPYRSVIDNEVVFKSDDHRIELLYWFGVIDDIIDHMRRVSPHGR